MPYLITIALFVIACVLAFGSILFSQMAGIASGGNGPNKSSNILTAASFLIACMSILFAFLAGASLGGW